jgi:hypothetical protein
MSAQRKPRPQAMTAKDRQFDTLLRRAAQHIQQVAVDMRARRDISPVVWRVVCCVLILHVCCPGGTWAQTPTAQALGSMQAAGETYLNGMRAAGEQTIFPGETVRTGADGVAALTLPGVGMFNIEPQTEISFGTSRYLATLKQGTVEVRSFQSDKILDVQFGKSVMYLPVSEVEAAVTVTVGADGAARVGCHAGWVGVTAIEGPEGVFLLPDQSAEISADGKIQKVNPVALAAPGSAGQARGPTRPAGKKSHPGYIVLGAVAAGGSVAVALALSHKSSSQLVSPSVP